MRGCDDAARAGVESKDAVKLVAGLLTTISGLVLGLLIASAQGSFDTGQRGFEAKRGKGYRC